MRRSDPEQCQGGKGSSSLSLQVTAHRQGRNSSKTLSQKPWRQATCWVTNRLMLSYLTHSRTICPGNCITHSGWNLPISMNQVYTTPHRPIGIPADPSSQGKSTCETPFSGGSKLSGWQLKLSRTLLSEVTLLRSTESRQFCLCYSFWFYVYLYGFCLCYLGSMEMHLLLFLPEEFKVYVLFCARKLLFFFR